jgi:nicotinamide-nucleotide amidase
MTDKVIPKLREKFALPYVVHQMIRTIGIGESWLSEKIAPWEKSLPAEIKLAYLPSLGQVKLRLTSHSADKKATIAAIDKEIERLKPLAGQYIYGYGSIEIEAAVGQLLREKSLTIGTAESCTGGYLAHMITRVPGSSSYFKGSIIAYSNEVKEKKLGVATETLQSHGAVSEETVIEMAKGVQKELGVEIGIATSGIAGPDGGTEEKPVGTIWVAIAYRDKVETTQLKLFKDRVLNIKLTSISSLAMLWRILLK